MNQGTPNNTVAPAKPSVSVEFFPPKTEEGARQILETARVIQPHGIAFASITYGAGGTTRELTSEYGKMLQTLFNFKVVPHLTCVGHSRDRLISILDCLLNQGFDGIMALRGDPPKGETRFTPPPKGLAHASDLVALAFNCARIHARNVRRQGGRPKPFTIGVAGYPECHPEAKDAATDLLWLKHKVAKGAEFVTTQLFFDNAAYFSFVKRCREAGITVPIIAGILPPLSLAQVRRFCAGGNISLPAELVSRLEACGDDAEAAQNVGADWAFAQISELVAGGAPGIHLYLLNRVNPAQALFSRLAAAGLVA